MEMINFYKAFKREASIIFTQVSPIIIPRDNILMIIFNHLRFHTIIRDPIIYPFRIDGNTLNHLSLNSLFLSLSGRMNRDALTVEKGIKKIISR